MQWCRPQSCLIPNKGGCKSIPIALESLSGRAVWCYFPNSDQTAQGKGHTINTSIQKGRNEAECLNNFFWSWNYAHKSKGQMVNDKGEKEKAEKGHSIVNLRGTSLFGVPGDSNLGKHSKNQGHLIMGWTERLRLWLSQS